MLCVFSPSLCAYYYPACGVCGQAPRTTELFLPAFRGRLSKSCGQTSPTYLLYSFQTFAVCPQDGRIHKRLLPSHPAHQDNDIASEVHSSFYSVYPVARIARYQIEGPLNLRSVYSFSSRVGTSFGPIGLVRVALSFCPVFGS